jgi:hypothetical protein
MRPPFDGDVDALAAVGQGGVAYDDIHGAPGIDPQEFFSLSTAEQPSFDKLLAYGRELASIASTAQSELIKSAQGTIKQVTDLAATPATVVPKTPPALAAAVSAAVTAISTPAPAVVAKAETPPANEPVAAPAPLPKAAREPAKPKPVAAPVAALDAPVETKVTTIKPSFPAPPPKPIALAPEPKPAKLKAVTPKPNVYTIEADRRLRAPALARLYPRPAPCWPAWPCLTVWCRARSAP